MRAMLNAIIGEPRMNIAGLHMRRNGHLSQAQTPDTPPGKGGTTSF
jgi:hypothetical protein